MTRRYPNTPRRGRPSTPLEVILSASGGLIIKHLYHWSYEEIESRFAGWAIVLLFASSAVSTLRAFPMISAAGGLIRWSHLISDDTLKKLHEHLVHEARRRKITRGRKLRIDTTVVETNIHYPTDSTLLEDSVRVIARTVKKAKQLIPTLPATLVRDFTRSTKRQVLSILKLGRTDEVKMAAKWAYQRLCETTSRAVTAAKRIKDVLRENSSEAANKLVQNLSPALRDWNGDQADSSTCCARSRCSRRGETCQYLFPKGLLDTPRIINFKEQFCTEN